MRFIYLIIAYIWFGGYIGLYFVLYVTGPSYWLFALDMVMGSLFLWLAFRQGEDREYKRLEALANKACNSEWTERHWQSANHDFLEYKIKHGYEERLGEE